MHTCFVGDGAKCRNSWEDAARSPGGLQPATCNPAVTFFARSPATAYNSKPCFTHLLRKRSSSISDTEVRLSSPPEAAWFASGPRAAGRIRMRTATPQLPACPATTAWQSVLSMLAHVSPPPPSPSLPSPSPPPPATPPPPQSKPPCVFTDPFELKKAVQAFNYSAKNATCGPIRACNRASRGKDSNCRGFPWSWRQPTWRNPAVCNKYSRTSTTTLQQNRATVSTSWHDQLVD